MWEVVGAGGDKRPVLRWRVTIVFGAAILIWILVHQTAEAIFGPDYDRLRHILAAMATSALAVPLVVLARRRLDRRPWAGLALASPRTGWRPLLLGAGYYLVPAAIGTAGCLALGWTRIRWTEADPWAAAAGTLFSAALLVLLVFLFEALPEELIFRGYLYRNLVTVLPRWLANLAQAGLFTAFGVAIGAAPTIDRVLILFFFAWILGVFRAVTGNLWAPIGFHLAFQTCAQLVGPSWDVFTVSSLDVLQTVGLGAIPLIVAVVAIQLHRRRELRSALREPDLDT